MRVPTLKRTLSIFVLLFAATAVLAGPPSARTGVRAAYDESDGVIVMFGGQAEPDLATAQTPALDETYVWDGTRWIRRYPPVSPSPRSIHMMVYDAERENVVLFGGRSGVTDLADTWAFEDGRWSRIETGAAPEKRSVAGFEFDRSRGVTVLFGGQRLSDDARSFINFYDMWEFDGSGWTQVMATGPEVLKPTLVFDEARNQLLLLGVNPSSDTLMYAYDAAANAWNELKPETLPVCANDISVTYVDSEEKVFLVGGQCPKEGVGTTEELYTWDGTNWTLVETETLLARGVNRAIAYDKARDVVVMFGGAFSFTTAPRATTNAFSFGNWSFPQDLSSPGPRSLFGMATDGARGVIYMTSGLTDDGFFNDFWKFESGFWHQITLDETAPQCAIPLTAFDSNRGKLVYLCNDSALHEFDGTEWKKIEGLRTNPSPRRFAAMVYDENLRKTVLFGGYEDQNANYTNRTWTWDGSTWVEVKKKRPHLRALHSMWYDPILRRTVIYGGLGRKNKDGRLERWSDMWSFNGTDWVEIKPSALPAARYGAQIAVNPNSGRTLLFGGLRVETGENGLQKQVYANDTWEWDGTTWRQLNPDGAPSPRENGSLSFDPASNRMILFGGWSGYFHGDTWEYDPAANRWRVFAE
ncbi:MAG TPA: kelch repeat-containing protein [Thermoanaerobaculia bacterium]|nr:kelch repeat-containing protein [Thermoanaerobaculia bacterium]